MFPLARYRLHFTATTPVHFPEWAGSVLRGGFGHALRQLACMTRQKDCAGCPLLSTCPYPAIFAPPPVEHSLQRFSQPPAPYLIEPASWGARHIAPGENWHLDMVLMGRALRELPLIHLAWQRAAQRGLGPGDGQSELTQVETFTTIETTAGPGVDSEKTPKSSREITLHFRTPLRLQDNGRAVPPDKLDAERLLMNLVRRISLLAEFHGHGAPDWDFKALKQAAIAVNSEKHLKWQDWTRRSSRQQQTMQLGGAIGRWTLRGDLTPFLPALYLGQWLHVGKETVFGLGRYTLEETSGKTTNLPERPVQTTDFVEQSTPPQ